MAPKDHKKRLYVYRLDAAGKWHYGRNPVTDPELARSFFRWLEQAPDGSWSFECEGERCRAVVEDAPQFVETVRAVAPDGLLAAVELMLASGLSEPLDPSTLVSAPNGALYCRLRSGQTAKFLKGPQLELSRWVDDQLRLTVGGRSWPIAEQAPSRGRN